MKYFDPFKLSWPISRKVWSKFTKETWNRSSAILTFYPCCTEDKKRNLPVQEKSPLSACKFVLSNNWVKISGAAFHFSMYRHMWIMVRKIREQISFLFLLLLPCIFTKIEWRYTHSCAVPNRVIISNKVLIRTKQIIMGRWLQIFASRTAMYMQPSQV